MRAEYNMLDGMQVNGGVRDGVVPGDLIEMPIPQDVNWVCTGDSRDCAMSPPMLSRSYRVTGYATVAILEEII